MWHKPCRTFHPWWPCIKTRCLSIIVNTNLTIWDLLQAIIPFANCAILCTVSLDMARRCKELRNFHQIKSTIHCLGIKLTNIRVLWDHVCLNSCRFLTSAVWEMGSDRGDPMFYSLIGRSILKNWAFAPQLGVLIPQREQSPDGFLTDNYVIRGFSSNINFLNFRKQ